MARMLFTWELGGGLGHMMQILPLARELKKRGHRVAVALRDLSRSRTVFDDNAITLLQAPVKVGPPATAFRPPYTLAHILHNVGYAEAAELAGMTAAWRGLFETVRPEVIVCDHSPTALLASRGLNVRRIAMGAGFFCPPDQHPLPNLRSWLAVDQEGLRRDEERVLERINQVLKNLEIPALDRITQIYSEVDDTFLLSFQELDHYPSRPGGMRYRGAWLPPGGKQPQWPAGSGRRIYAYLKNFPALPQVLEHLRARGWPTLVFVDGISRLMQDKFRSPALQFENERLDIRAVASECDAAILNANHGTAIALLLAGKPMLQLPLYLEQGLLAGAITRLGAGLQADVTNPKQIIDQLTRLLESPQFANAAASFSSRYSTFNFGSELELMICRLEELIGVGRG